jgi:hypothetical protein
LNPIKFVYRLFVKEKCTCYKIPAIFIQGGFECPVCTRKREKYYKNPPPPPDPALYLEGIQVGEVVSIEEGRYAGNDAEVKGLDHDSEELIVRVIKGRRSDYTVFSEAWGMQVLGPPEYLGDGTARIPALCAQLSVAICDGRSLGKKRHAKLFESIAASHPEGFNEPFELQDLRGKYPSEK